MSTRSWAAPVKTVLRSIPVFRHDGTAKVFYNAILILAALAGTIITSYRLTFQDYTTDASTGSSR